jgi:hypothetical protein
VTMSADSSELAVPVRGTAPPEWLSRVTLRLAHSGWRQLDKAGHTTALAARESVFHVFRWKRLFLLLIQPRSLVSGVAATTFGW